MVLFALLMLAAAISMIRSNSNQPVPAIGKKRVGGLVIQGFLVGAITGLLGAGGGFLIIPALVLISRLPMKIAVGSSLTIMAISSYFGFFTTLSHYHINWSLLLSITAIAVAGIFVGTALSDKIPGQAKRFRLVCNGYRVIYPYSSVVFSLAGLLTITCHCDKSHILLKPLY
jgi:uncharacterized membrane protein YfcA